MQEVQVNPVDGAQEYTPPPPLTLPYKVVLLPEHIVALGPALIAGAQRLITSVDVPQPLVTVRV